MRTWIRTCRPSSSPQRASLRWSRTSRCISRRWFVELNALAEARFGDVAIFVNAINLTNVRQTNYDPLLRPSPGPGGNPITDVWAPLDGRTFNLGIRAEL
jgi:hypothetical protein